MIELVKFEFCKTFFDENLWKQHCYQIKAKKNPILIQLLSGKCFFFGWRNPPKTKKKKEKEKEKEKEKGMALPDRWELGWQKCWQ